MQERGCGFDPAVGVAYRVVFPRKGRSGSHRIDKLASQSDPRRNRFVLSAEMGSRLCGSVIRPVPHKDGPFELFHSPDQSLNSFDFNF